jgi:hypothetical protein
MIRFPSGRSAANEALLDDLRRELAIISDAALASTYETYRMACGLRKDGPPESRYDAVLLATLGRVSTQAVGASPGMKCVSYSEYVVGRHAGNTGPTCTFPLDLDARIRLLHRERFPSGDERQVEIN